MRYRRWDDTDRGKGRQDPDWPHLSDGAFRILTAAVLALAVVICVLTLARSP
jgi:hypothetical protein